MECLLTLFPSLSLSQASMRSVAYMAPDWGLDPIPQGGATFVAPSNTPKHKEMVLYCHVKQKKILVAQKI